jgi:parvulin-like peptidyl-prolyl isomerase
MKFEKESKVMRKRIVFSVISLGVLLALAGCGKIQLPGAKKPMVKEDGVQAAPVVTGTIIAKVNNIPITLENLVQEIDTFNATVPADKPTEKIDTRDEKIDYLKKEMVQRVLLYQEALDRGMDRREVVVSSLEKAKQDLLVVELAKEEAKSVDVTSKEIEDYYNAAKDQLKEPEQRQIRQIVVATEAEAKDILIQLLQGADFAQLAKDRSKDAAAANGGDLGLLELGQKFKQFDEIAFSDNLGVGQTSNYFKGPDGYYIVKVEAKRGGKQKTVSELWDDIKRYLLFVKQQKQIDDLISKLSQKAKIEVYEGAIK